MSAYRVLLVDDDAFFLRVHADYLASHGIEVETAPSGEVALSLFSNKTFDLLIADLVMPGISGFELVDAMRSRVPSQDIVIITSTEDVKTAVRAMHLGVYDYLVKPVESEALLRVIDSLRNRPELYDDHARLVRENTQHQALQNVFEKALAIMDSLDLEVVVEKILETLADVCGAQAAALWTSPGENDDYTLHGYRGLVDPLKQPARLKIDLLPFVAELEAGFPVPIGKSLLLLEREVMPSQGLLVPICSSDDRFLGMVHITDKIGGGFTAFDTSQAKIIADASAMAISHAQKFQHLEKIGLRDSLTTAYNMVFFVDYLGRELHKARRYKRNFALIQVKVDSIGSLKENLEPEQFKEMTRLLAHALSSVLRDVDVMARVSDDEMFVLLPEVDFLGSLTFIRKARDAIGGNPFLKQLDREHPINLSFGPSSFPRDGDDVDQLFAASSRRIDEGRQSLFRRFHLEQEDFWSLNDYLLEDAAQKAKTGKRSLLEDKDGRSAHQLFTPEMLSALELEVCRMAGKQRNQNGWFFLGGSFKEHSPAMLEMVIGEPDSRLHTYFLGNDLPDLFEDATITPVHIEGDDFQDSRIIFLLAEHASYALVARKREDGDGFYGFHTSDWTVVESLIHRLQEEYGLHRGSA